MFTCQRTRDVFLAAACLFATSSVVNGTVRADTVPDTSESATRFDSQRGTQTEGGDQLEASTNGSVHGVRIRTGSSCRRSSPFYASVEAIFLDRDNGSFNQPLVVDVNSGNTVLSTASLGFDYEPGVRATIGLEPPCRCSAGWEFTYLGVFEWDSFSLATGNDDLAVPGDLGFVANGFTLAESIRADYWSKLHGAEANRVTCLHEYCRGPRYERVDGFVGFRYLSLDEDLTLLGHNQSVADALYNVDTDNNLFGAQIGSRMRTYHSHWGLEILGKAGIFSNDASQRQFIVDELGVNDVLLRSASAGSDDVAFVGELDLSLLLRLTDTCGLRCGYNLLWIEGIALAPDQLDFSDTALSGTGLQAGGGSFSHGVNVGLELDW